MRFEFIREHVHVHEIRTMCHVLDVTTSGYYDWRERPASKHDLEDEALLIEIRQIFEASRGLYGSPRVHAELIHHGRAVSRKRVARLMREDGLVARRPKRFKKTTLSDHDRRVAPNVLDRNFNVDKPDRVWVGDITYIWTYEGWLYLAVLLDLASRRVVGWAAADHMRDELTLEALNAALQRRSGHADLTDLVHHSDRGSQYASDDYIAALEDRGITRSMSRKGNCWDNAVAESFFATLKKELIHLNDFENRQQALEALFDYIEIYYNRQRRHSNNHFLSPASYEATQGVFL